MVSFFLAVQIQPQIALKGKEIDLIVIPSGSHNLCRWRLAKPGRSKTNAI